VPLVATMLMVTLDAAPPGEGPVGVVGLSLSPPPHPAEAMAIARTAHRWTMSLDMTSSFPARRIEGQESNQVERP
jgi:hypothetical protein